MSNVNTQGFTRKELADFYEKVILYGELMKDDSSWSLTTRSKQFRKLKIELDLDIKRFATTKEFHDYLQTTKNFDRESKANFIWFYDTQSNSLKSILVAFRNAAAHADIKRKKNGQIWYSIDHKLYGKQKITSQMRMSDFWKFLESAKKCKTAKIKDGEA